MLKNTPSESAPKSSFRRNIELLLASLMITATVSCNNPVEEEAQKAPASELRPKSKIVPTDTPKKIKKNEEGQRNNFKGGNKGGVPVINTASVGMG